jgi:hypothetical protein
MSHSAFNYPALTLTMLMGCQLLAWNPLKRRERYRNTYIMEVNESIADAGRKGVSNLATIVSEVKDLLAAMHKVWSPGELVSS